jgi:hypothetical protein
VGVGSGVAYEVAFFFEPFDAGFVLFDADDGGDTFFYEVDMVVVVAGFDHASWGEDHFLDVFGEELREARGCLSEFVECFEILFHKGGWFDSLEKLCLD